MHETHTEYETHRVTRTTSHTTSSGGVTRTTTSTSTSFTGSGAGTPGLLTIDIDEGACARGRLSTDITVSLDGTRRTFSASCNFTLSQTFDLGDDECTVRSGMCSHFMDRGRVTAQCGAARQERRFACAER